MRPRSYFAIFVYIVFANIPFWVASHSMGLLFKGPFSDEFVLVGILSAFLRRTLTVVLLLIAILLDMLNSIATTYLLSASDMLQSARSLFEFAPSHLWDIVVIALCIVMVCLMAILTASNGIGNRERGYFVGTLAIFILLCATFDAATGHILASRQNRQLGTLCLARFGGHFLVMSVIERRRFEIPVSAGTHTSVPAASAIIAGFETASLSSPTKAIVPNVVLILVESWGKPLATDLEESLVQPYRDKNLTEEYTVSRGAVPYYEPTIAGEARELCSSSMGFGLLSATRLELESCLPTKMRKMGYHSMAIHGFTGRIFDRSKWYDRIGFDETWFRDQLQTEGLPLCPGPFPGVCDAAAAAWIGDRLQRSSKSPQFIYWVTLNSHLPVPIPNHVKSPAPCSDVSATTDDATLCSWYQLIFNVHRSVSELALRSTVRPTVFLVVGDHAPPFPALRLRDQFSDQVVPYVLLMPKRNEMREGSPSTRSVVVVKSPPNVVRKPHLNRAKSASFPAVG
jgi:hypothetical protein